MSIQTKQGRLLTLGTAEPADLESILSLQYLAWQSEAELLGTRDIPPLQQSLADMTAEFQTSLFLKVMDENKQIIASVRGRVQGATCHIGKLMVHPALQGQGIGSQLLLEMERRSGCARFELFTSTKSLGNISLYQKAGYTLFKTQKISENVNLAYFQKTV